MKIRYFEKRGVWWLDFRDAQGKRRRMPSGCTTEAEAKRASPGILARALAGDSAEPRADSFGQIVPHAGFSPKKDAPSITFEQAYKKALNEREKWILAKDQAGLELKYEKTIAYWGANTPLATATRESVLEWRAALLRSPGKRKGTTLSNSSINHMLSFLQCLLEVCNLPPHGVKHLSTQGNERKRRVRQEELDAVIEWLETARTHRKVPYKGAAAFADLIRVALASGARQGEWLAVKWKDVYVDRGVVCFRDTKNGEMREVMLTQESQEILQHRKAIGIEPGPFSDLDSDRCTALWSDARKALGLADDHEFVFHVGTRHEALSRAGETGVNTFLFMGLSGHKSPAAARRYVKPTVGAQRALVEAIANYNPASTVSSLIGDN